jgi:hypothetical protein
VRLGPVAAFIVLAALIAFLGYVLRPWVRKWGKSYTASLSITEGEAEAAFKARNKNLISTLEIRGHSLLFYTYRPTSVHAEGGSGVIFDWVTGMRCTKCGVKYRDTWVGRRRGLSPDRPCKAI